MIRIYLETGSDKTSEFVFTRTLLETLYEKTFIEEKIELIHVGGKDNLNQVVNQLKENNLKGEKNLVIFDADFDSASIIDGGFTKRKAALEKEKVKLGVNFELFLFPNHRDDGDFETLLEEIAQKGKHAHFFDCYEKYEECIELKKNADGVTIYTTPNRKGKLHTYISAMPLSKKQRDSLGQGKWLFDNKDYWDLDSEYLNPLKDFLKRNI